MGGRGRGGPGRRYARGGSARSSGGNGWLIAIIVILVIALVAGYFLFVREDSTPTTPTPSPSVTLEE